MTKIPIRTRLPVEAWTVAVLVTLYSLLSAIAHHLPADTSAPAALYAKLIAAGDSLTTSTIR